MPVELLSGAYLLELAETPSRLFIKGSLPHMVLHEYILYRSADCVFLTEFKWAFAMRLWLKKVVGAVRGQLTSTRKFS